MEIHNLMEDIVFRMVDEVLQEESKQKEKEYLMSPQCRMDLVCFVLNRIPQYYVTSGRGMAHTERTLKENPQLRVDIVTLIHEGLKRIETVRRPYYDTPLKSRLIEGPVFILPTIKGKLLNCTNFEPIQGVSIELRWEDDLLPMIDNRWQNPFYLDAKLEGTFLFLPSPIPATKPGEQRTFELEIRVQDDRFEPFHHYFKIELVAEEEMEAIPWKNPDHKLPELFLIPK
ncbi:MAG: late competence development ComFB family protein [Spirochaetes bacterium]|nr:late competence development ComFB family protein [Spirochaetota bacterium]